MAENRSPVEEIQELAPQAKIEMLKDEVEQLRKALEISGCGNGSDDWKRSVKEKP